MVIQTPSQALSTDPLAISALADRIITGETASPVELRELLDVIPGSPAAEALFAAAQRIRAHYVGMQLKACSVINVKAGNCSENCSYCAQASGSDNDGYKKSKWLPEADIQRAAETSAANGAQAVSLVAAWWGVKEGTQLDMVTDSIRKFAQNGKVRPDVNLGILAHWVSGEPYAKEPEKCEEWRWTDPALLPEPMFAASKVVIGNWLSGSLYTEPNAGNRSQS